MFFRKLGKSIAVHTPPKKVTTCEILPLGKYIILALENQPNLVTLELRNSSNNQTNAATGDTTDDDITTYGDEENHGKTIQL